MKLTIALALLLPSATGTQPNAGHRSLRRRGRWRWGRATNNDEAISNDEATGDVITDDDIDADRYWMAPIRGVGLTCIDNSIRAGGTKDDDYKCIREGEAICITYDHQYFGGKWTFGIQNSMVKLWNPRMQVVWEYCTDVTHVCIGEDHEWPLPNRYSKERPYMTFYNKKTDEVVGSLTCDGTDGKDGKNIGTASILKLVDQAELGQYVTYPIDIVKFKKGQTPDPDDDNSLWNITYNPNNPQQLWFDSTRDNYDATYAYNHDKCEWTDQCPSNAPSSVPSMVGVIPTASAEPSATPSTSPSVIPSASPSDGPKAIPSTSPSVVPSASPWDEPSDIPSKVPSALPSEIPSASPSVKPTDPDATPTPQAAATPTPSFEPSDTPSLSPSDGPSDTPSSTPSLIPTAQPVPDPSDQPVPDPTDQPVPDPTEPPVNPSVSPSDGPSDAPSSTPSDTPSESSMPSGDPSSAPSVSVMPSFAPTQTCDNIAPFPAPATQCAPSPGNDPSTKACCVQGGPMDPPNFSCKEVDGSNACKPGPADPEHCVHRNVTCADGQVCCLEESGSGMDKTRTWCCATNTADCTNFGCLSASPSSVPTLTPPTPEIPDNTQSPSDAPSTSPSSIPSASPSDGPSDTPSTSPSDGPSDDPSSTPSVLPSESPNPSSIPSNMPSESSMPSGDPSSLPSVIPSTSPSVIPSASPSDGPSDDPSSTPSVLPSESPNPSSIPSNMPSESSMPSGDPSSLPSVIPSTSPSSIPSASPSDGPSDTPSFTPSDRPSDDPSSLPSDIPSGDPSSAPSISVMPSIAPTETCDNTVAFPGDTTCAPGQGAPPSIKACCTPPGMSSITCKEVKNPMECNKGPADPEFCEYQNIICADGQFCCTDGNNPNPTWCCVADLSDCPTETTGTITCASASPISDAPSGAPSISPTITDCLPEGGQPQNCGGKNTCCRPDTCKNCNSAGNFCGACP